ncbi:CHIP6 protein [Cercophora scortea]|uniref:CHIP6 protein n=1 Tax=Cercophora scortea TaxID=314031 RepID=A0AAE0IZ92_9PEZI|nr:CHIP6 protein [Cercophora scortea]
MSRSLEAQPSFASSEGGGNTPVRLEKVDYDGHPVTVARDPEGHTVYPAPVPGETQSPTSAISPTTQIQPTVPAPPNEHPRKVKSDPPGKSKASAPRPSATVGKQWTSESARRGHRGTSSILPPAMRRAGTNVSELSQALWTTSQYRTGDSSSSSSSSSDSSDEETGPGDGAADPKAKSRKQKHDDDDHHFRHFHVGNENYRTKGRVSKRDGRLNISVKDTSNKGYLAKALGTAVQKVMPPRQGDGDVRPGTSRMSSASTAAGLDKISCPRLNIVIMVIGSRGDAQPFLKIGKVLKEQCGHRVRIATHPAFRDFVEKDSGLEFFSVGGDPSELMAFMVKNPGMIPTLETVKAGDIGRRRAAMAEMFGGFWRACINATDDEKDTRNVKMMGERDPFVADAIIANPPSFAHVHCAEALGIPLHLMFTFPYTPTQSFPHPLASIKKSNVDPGYTNFISYPLVEMMVWQGLGDLVNDFRVKTLGLDPVSTLWAPGATYRLHVPITYLWSPGLVPKPEDWGDEVDVSGFVFLDLASSFTPPDPLTKFLDAGEAPIYIGFGSIVVDDANSFTNMIFEAVKTAGVRALVSKGWGGLGGDSLDVPDNIFLLDNTPHDWLFPRVRACVIHGGAGTTAMALKCGKPTMVVPFFGDQHFWGSMLEKVKAGPEPMPHKDLTVEKLAEGIKYCLTDEAVKAAQKIAKDIELEGDGAENACMAFHKHLTLSGKNSMRCSILEDRVAVWQLKNTNLRLSPMAADIAADRGFVSWKKLRLLRHNEWNDFEGPGEPVTGVAGSLMNSVGDVFSGIGGVPYRVARGANKRRERKQKREKKEQKRKQKEVEAGKASVDGQDGSGAGSKKSKGANEASSSPPAKPTQATDYATGVTKTITPEASHSQGGHDKNKPTQTDAPTRTALPRRSTDQTTSTIDEEDTNPAEEIANQVGRGAAKTATALARAPMDLSLALAQGFHNAPRLYGDDTVRRPTRVTGIKSGLRAAGHEFVYGIYDGWTGVVRLPVRGAREGGVRGFLTGVGMGLTGFVLKDIAAIIGPVGYTLKGIAKQAERSKQPIRYIRRARIVQGQREVGALGEAERRKVEEEVVRGWETMRRLWEVMEGEEKKQGGRGRLFGGAGKRRKRGLGAAFESVDTAGKTLEAMKNGEGVESVVGRDDGRKKGEEDAGKSSPDDAAAKREGKKEGERDGTRDGEGVAEARMNGGNGKALEEDGHHDDEREGGNQAAKKHAEEEEEKEKENPFATNSLDVARNKADSKGVVESGFMKGKR